jgi:hypothetical protein
VSFLQVQGKGEGLRRHPGGLSPRTFQVKEGSPRRLLLQRGLHLRRKKKKTLKRGGHQSKEALGEDFAEDFPSDLKLTGFPIREETLGGGENQET